MMFEAFTRVGNESRMHKTTNSSIHDSFNRTSQPVSLTVDREA